MATIKTPGKFEGEQGYVPYLWDCVLDGFSEPTYSEDGESVINDRIELTDEDKAKYPELIGYRYADLCEDSVGFVYCTLVR